MTVELIYFDGCPNVDLARERLKQAFAVVKMKPQWQEWDREDPASPAHVRHYGSPTVLVNGRDVTGSPPSPEEAGSCRVYTEGSGALDGAPSVQAIASALMARDKEVPGSTNQGNGGWKGSFAAFPAIGAAALPKLTCPACWPAYSGLLSSAGLGFVNYTPYLLPLTAGFLLLSLGALGYRATRRRGFGPFTLGAAASAVLLIGKFLFDSDAAMYVGIAALMGASMWNAWPRADRGAITCPSCTATPEEHAK
jgi:mercuric ion transport protein